MTDERIERLGSIVTRFGDVQGVRDLASLESELTELRDRTEDLSTRPDFTAYNKALDERDAAREVVEAARGFLWALASANGTEGPDLRDENLGYLRTALSHHHEVTGEARP